MGNEMGNNNTTGLKEEESLTVEEPKGLSKETSSFDHVKAENQVEPDLEAKDFQEKANGLASDHDPQTPNREEKEQNGDFPVVDSPAVGPDEEGNESSENQQVSLPNDDEDEGLIELNMDKIVPSNCEDQPQKEASYFNKEEQGMTNSDFDKIWIPSHDEVPEKTGSSECDQAESATIHAEPSEPDTNGSNVGTEQVTGLSSACDSTENGDVSDTMVAENLEVSVAPETSTITDKEAEEEKGLCEEKFELEDEDKLESVMNGFSMQPNDPMALEEKAEQVFSTKANLMRDDSSESESESESKLEAISVTNSPNSHQKIDESEAKSIVFSEETREKPCESRDSNVLQSDSITEEPEEAKVSEDHESKQIMIEENSTEKRIVEQEVKDSSEIDPLSDESTLSSTNLIAGIIVSMNELAFDSTGVKQCVEKPEPFATRESVVERLSTDSDRDSVQYAQMRKSPSFSLDLQSEESEQTPLLFEDKATIETSRSCEEIVNYSLTLNVSGYGGEEQAMGVEEKVVRLERSDSEKSKTPFLEFLKEDEELVKPQKERKAQKEAKSVVSSSTKVTISTTSTKGKEKRNKAKSSLFGNCMCCATMIN